MRIFVRECTRVACARMCGCGSKGADVCCRACSLNYPTCKAAFATLSSASLAPSYFTTLSHKSHDFHKKDTEFEMSIVIFSTTFI